MLSDYGYDRVNQSCHRKPTQHRHHTPGKHGEPARTRHNTRPHPDTASAHAFRLSLSFPVMLSDYGYDRVSQSCQRKRTQHRHHTPGKHGDTTGTRHNRYIRQPQTRPRKCIKCIDCNKP